MNEYEDTDKLSTQKIFKSASHLTSEEIKSVLMKKIDEESEKIHEDQEDIEILKSINYNDEKINIVSLFSGAGGLDIGTELAGLTTLIGFDNAVKIFNSSKKEWNEIQKNNIFHTIYTNDMFKEANETYSINFSDGIVQHQKDIRKVAVFPKNDFMIGGFPCPGFSEAGPRLLDDKRNFLYIHFIRALVQTQPLFFVAENVKGMMTLGNGEVLKQIIEDFSSAGYTVTPHLVNARDYGVPQSRERVFLVGVHKEKIEKKYGFSYILPEPTHVNPDLYDLLAKNKKNWVTLEDAIKDLEKDPGDVFEGSYSSMYLSRNRKKNWNEQSFTIQASGRQAPQHPGGMPMEKIGPNKWIFKGEHNRRLSTKEIQRIQTFPDWFTFSQGNEYGTSGKLISKNARIDRVYKQVGNAVPPLLARAIIQPISDFLYNEIKQAST